MTTEQSKTRKYLVVVFALIGVGGVLAGMIHALSILSLGFTSIGLADAIFNTVAGVIALICARLLAKGKSLVIFVYIGDVLLSIGYSLAVGRGFNYIIAAIGFYFLWRLISLRQNGELA